MNLVKTIKLGRKKCFINNNLRNLTNEDVKNDITANCIKKKMDIISKLKNSLGI